MDLPISHDQIHADLTAARDHLTRLLAILESPRLCAAENDEQIELPTITGVKILDGAAFLRRFHSEIALCGQKLNVLAMSLESQVP